MNQEQQNHFEPKPVKKDVQGEVPVYDDRTINYLLSLLTKDDKEIFRDIYEKTIENILHYQKTKVPNFYGKRKVYEAAWNKLEAQGFVLPMKVATMRVFYVTDNGRRAIQIMDGQAKE
ncbi:hypothetical protein ACMGD3_24130 [Lysinibacillus sphaericus]|uniref:hypothetical protein n=1 Tax=Lysinibacillus sphaericus TaxID=1421 RepID=UPI003F79E85F